MTHNHTTFFAVNYLSAVIVDGKECAAFLQGQLTADVAGLPSGEWRRAAYCSVQGRILATMLMARYEEGFILLMAADLAQDFINRLSRFILRAKVKMSLSSAAIDASMAHDSAPVNIDKGQVTINDNMVFFDEGAGAMLRVSIDSPPQMGDGDAWRRMQILRGIPWVDAAVRESFIPQYINWELIGGVNFQKGCYVGQEIIARLHYLGNIKRRGYIVYVATTPSKIDIPAAEIININESGGTAAFVSMARGNVERLREYPNILAVEEPPYGLPSALDDKKQRPKI